MDAVITHSKKDDPEICEVDGCSGGGCYFCKACVVKLCPSHLPESLHPCKAWRSLVHYMEVGEEVAA
jgi:hypothetical protein